jgi:hypothetical protein
VAIYGPGVVSVKVGAQDISQYIQVISGIDLTVDTEEQTPFGVTTKTHASTGVKSYAQFTMDGFYDDTITTGPDALLGPAALGTTVNIAIGYGAAKATTLPCIVKGYRRLPRRGALTGAQYTLLPTGPATEA